MGKGVGRVLVLAIFSAAHVLAGFCKQSIISNLNAVSTCLWSL